MKEGTRALAASVVLEALKDLHVRRTHGIQTAQNRRSARKFFFGCLRDAPAPFNLAFCCEVLNLRADVVRKAVKKKRLDEEAMKSLVRA